MNTIYEELNDPGLKAWVVLYQDSEFNSPSAAYCQEYLASHPMSMTLLYDPSGGMSIYGAMETSLVVNEDGRIVNTFYRISPSEIRRALLQELVDVDDVCMQSSQCEEGAGCVPLAQPIQGHDIHVCAPLCALADPSTCAEGTTCTQLQEGQDGGACLPDDVPER